MSDRKLHLLPDNWCTHIRGWYYSQLTDITEALYHRQMGILGADVGLIGLIHSPGVINVQFDAT